MNLDRAREALAEAEAADATEKAELVKAQAELDASAELASTKPDFYIALSTAVVLADGRANHAQRQLELARAQHAAAVEADKRKRLATAAADADRAALFDRLAEALDLLGRANATLADAERHSPRELGIATEAYYTAERAILAALAEQHAAVAVVVELGGRALAVPLTDVLSGAYVEQLGVAPVLDIEAVFSIRFERTDDRPDRSRIMTSGVNPIVVARRACRLGNWADAVREVVPADASELHNRAITAELLASGADPIGDHALGHRRSATRYIEEPLA